MTVLLGTPTEDDLADVVATLASWQDDTGSVALHPGDLGWNWRVGAEAMTAALRTWSRDGELVAVGLLDNPSLIRLDVRPDTRADGGLAAELADTLPASIEQVEARRGEALRGVLAARGWRDDEAWSPLRRDLTEPPEAPGIRVEVVDEHRVPDRVAVHRAAFDNSTFTVDQWHVMAAGPAYRRARCLVGYDDHDRPVAATTVWSAGPGNRGLLEPVGVHRDHRGRGHGRAITLAAAATLRELGASSAVVCTPSVLEGAVATYVSAGFTRLPESRDLRRP